MAEKPDFYGRGWKFPPSFDPMFRETAMITDEQSVRTSLEVLMGTTLGERIMQPAYGTDLPVYVFRNVNMSLATTLQNMIRDAIVQYEPRVAVNQVTVDISRSTEGILLINIDYNLRRTNTRSNIVFPFYLQEGNLIPEHLT